MDMKKSLWLKLRQKIKRNRINPLVIFTCLFSLLCIFRLEINPLASGIDPSWIYAINFATLHKLEWGSSFIFTYGPFGYLLRTVDIGNHVGERIIFELILSLGTALITIVYVRSISAIRGIAQFIFCAVLLYVIALQFQEWRLFAPFVLLLLVSQKKQKVLLTLLLGVLTGFYFLTKFSLGLTALVVFSMGTVGLLKSKECVLRFFLFSISLLAALVIFWLMAGGTIHSLFAYGFSQIELALGYSQAMSYYLASWKKEVLVFILFFITCILWIIRLGKKLSLATSAVILASLFMAWKAAIVRQDGHIIILSFFGIFIVVLLLVSSWEKEKGRSLLFAFASIILLLTASYFNPLAKNMVTSALVRPFLWMKGEDLVKVISPSGIARYKIEIANQSIEATQKLALPVGIRNIIGADTIDIYPWDLSYVFANGLNWTNRPVIQAYTSYTPYLDGLNAKFFSSPARPEYLLWHHDMYLGNGLGSIDGRDVLFEEPATILAIFNHYDLTFYQDNLTLLKSRQTNRFSQVSIVKTEKVPWNTWIDVPQNETGIETLSASHPVSPLLTLLRLFFRQAAISISVRFPTGEEVTYRLVPDTMQDGLIVSPFISSVDDLRMFLKMGKGRNSQSIRFNGDFVSKLTGELTLTWKNSSFLEDKLSQNIK